MSLVFLKNDTNNNRVSANDHLKPYNWANYFDSPLVLPPDSQVAYISSTMSRDEVIDLPEPDNVLWLQTGNAQMNIPMPIIFDTTQGAETWTQVLNQVTANAYTGQTDFMYDGLSGGLEATYNATTKKINIKLTQRLQPAVQGLWANRGQALNAPLWTGKNETGGGGSSGENSGILTTNISPGLNTTLWDIGWTSMDLNPGTGLPVGNPSEYTNGTYTCFFTSTGLKRSSDNVALTGLGGEVHFQGSLDPLAQLATANAQSKHYIAGLNSIQAIRSVTFDPLTETPSGAFVKGCVLNDTGVDTALHPNIIQIRVENQKVFVEVMNTHQAPDGSPIDRGAWGNCRSPPGAGISPYGMKIVEEIDIDPWLIAPLTQPQNIGGEASQPYFNAAQPVGIVQDNNNKIVFKIKWKNPYCFQVYMGTGYNQRTGKYDGTILAGGNQYAPGTAYQDTYSIIYDSEFGGTYSNDLAPDPDKTFFLPSYFGDMGFCGWMDRENKIEIRGNFDVINCYPQNPVAPYPSYDQMLRGRNGINMANIPPDYPNAYHLAAYEFGNIFPSLAVASTDKFDDGSTLATNAGYNDAAPILVCCPVNPTEPKQFQRWYPQPVSDATVYRTFAPAPNPDTRIGIIMGLVKNNENGALPFALQVANDLRVQNITGKEEVGETEQYNSVHIQLTNLPITSRNGMTSTASKTIAIVHNSLSTVTVGTQSRKLYNHYTNEKNFIDLNNVAEMTLNELRVYISNDANRPADYLVDKSDVVVMFRKRPESDTGVSRQVINKGGVYSSNGQMNR
tara:strand:+ start:244 stop:2607 length:2364 start_codon:yes stop_codon:yes gene_type:complete